MTREELEEIFEDEDTKWEGDNGMQGLVILQKYANGKDVLCGAENDIIFSLDIDEALENGITKEDAIALRKLNWMLDDEYGDCFSCFV